MPSGAITICKRGRSSESWRACIIEMLGITNEFSPRFLRRYANLYDLMKGAVENYISDVKSVDFPNNKEQY